MTTSPAATLTELLASYRQRRWRLQLWLQGDPQWLAQQLVLLQPVWSAAQTPLWLGDTPNDLLPQPLLSPATSPQDKTAGHGQTGLADGESQNATPRCSIQPISHKGQLLGTEADFIIINTLGGIDWDLYAAASGCLRAGGLWLILSRDTRHFVSAANPKAQRLLSYPQDANTATGLFNQFWYQQQQCAVYQSSGWQSSGWQSSGWQLPDHDLKRPSAESRPFCINAPNLPTPAWPFQTVDQQQAVAAIHHVVTGHRRRPLLLHAHRGRGKSAALGIAAALLQQQGKQKLVITAPQPAAADIALRHARQLLEHLAPNEPLALRFMPLDLLLQQQPTLDLLLVDEAAAIPLPQLKQLVQQHSRVVFASTEHGYEGTGRSFSLKFQPYLDQHCPGWRSFQLFEPIRYASDDPLEQQIFRSFLLTPELTPVTLPLQEPRQFRRIEAASLLQQPALLSQLFSLLALAHYQTNVSDLWSLLDNPALQIFGCFCQHQLLGCVLISVEGEFTTELAQAVFCGERRVQGHLLAQSLAFHLAEPQLACQKQWRIQRIVVHPAIQGQQLGSQLLQHIRQEAQQQQVALLGSSFGATLPLLKFWQHNGYQPVRLGLMAEQSSGAPSVLVIQPLQPQLQTVAQQLQQQFCSLLYQQLGDQQRQLPPELALWLCQAPQHPLSATDIQQLQLFAAGTRPLELVEHLLLRWFNLHARQLPSTEAYLLVKRFWQKQSVASLQGQGDISGKSEFCRLLRTLVQRSFHQC